MFEGMKLGWMGEALCMELIYMCLCLTYAETLVNGGYKDGKRR